MHLRGWDVVHRQQDDVSPATSRGIISINIFFVDQVRKRKNLQLQRKLWHQWKKRLIFSTFTMAWMHATLRLPQIIVFFCHCLHFVLQHFYYLLIELWSDKKDMNASVPRFFVCRHFCITRKFFCLTQMDLWLAKLNIYRRIFLVNLWERDKNFRRWNNCPRALPLPHEQKFLWYANLSW